MNRTLALVLVLAPVLAGADATLAQTTKQKTGPGQSEYAPGQQTGPAKKYAPGQLRKKKDDPKQPGASEYAPGQQGGTGTTSKSGTSTMPRKN